MTMKVNVFANFRQLVGAKSVEISLPEGSTLTQLLDTLLILHPRLEPVLVDNSRKLLPHIHVFVNGRDTQYLPEGKSTLLSPDDKVDIFPPVAGG
jgi:sulfur-carrier protein